MSTPRDGASVFVAQAAIKRRSRVGDGVFGVIGAGLAGWLASGFVPGLVARTALFDMGTEVYRTAQWASTTALASFVFVAGALAAWLLARSLRAFFGLPVRVVPGWVQGILTLRVIAALVVLGWLMLWSSDEVVVRRIAWAPLASLALGLAMCAQLTWDAPRLVRDAIAALRARLPILRVPLRPIAALPPSGLARTRGRVAWSADGESAVFRFDRPFRIEDEGGQALIDPTAGPLVVEVEAKGEDPDVPGATIVTSPGPHVEVLGEVQGGGGDAYRGGLPTITAGKGERPQPLLLFGGGGSMARRLVVAAVVELVCAALLASMPVGLAGTWMYLRHRAQPSVHKLPAEVIPDGPAPAYRRAHAPRKTR